MMTKVNNKFSLRILTGTVLKVHQLKKKKNLLNSTQINISKGLSTQYFADSYKQTEGISRIFRGYQYFQNFVSYLWLLSLIYIFIYIHFYVLQKDKPLVKEEYRIFFRMVTGMLINAGQ